MNGGSISGGAAFAAIADINRRATFIGEEAGSPPKAKLEAETSVPRSLSPNFTSGFPWNRFSRNRQE